jgi:hypothetical protein
MIWFELRNLINYIEFKIIEINLTNLQINKQIYGEKSIKSRKKVIKKILLKKKSIYFFEIK